MSIIGIFTTVVGFLLLWFDVVTGGITTILGVSLIWVANDQTVRRKNEENKFKQKLEEEFEDLKFRDPVSVRVFELATLIYGTTQPYKSWLLENLSEFERLYSSNASEAIDEIRNSETGKFKSLFSTTKNYIGICEFLEADFIDNIFDDIKNKVEGCKINSGSSEIKFEEVLNDYDLEEWATNKIDSYLLEDTSPDDIILKLKKASYSEFDKKLTVVILDGQFIINGRIKITSK